MHNRLLLIVGLVLCFTQSYAATVSNTIEQTSTVQNGAVISTTLCCAEDWGLNSDEWSHYQKLMKGESGVWYSQLTPSEVLGVNAQSVQEQLHFAELVAKEEHDRLARELTFDSAVHEAFLRLYANEPVIKSFDISAFNPLKTTVFSHTSLQPTDHVVLLVNANEGAEFTLLPSLLTLLKKHPGLTLDVYCLGNVTNDAIRQWATLSRVPSDLVSAGRITLNHQTPAMQKFATNVKLPLVLLSRDGNSKPVSVEDLV